MAGKTWFLDRMALLHDDMVASLPADAPAAHPTDAAPQV
jgi:hypothetical protein